MKKLFLFVVAILAISIGTFAQDTTANKKHDKKSLKDTYKGDKKDKKAAMKSLNLTEEQKNEMKANKDEYKSKAAAIEKDPNLSDAQKKEKKDALKKEKKAKNEKTLTPEQKEKMKAIKKEHKKRGKIATPKS